MDIMITGKNIDLTDSLKEYVYKRMGKLDQLYGRINMCEVILKKVKIRQEAEVILHLKRTRMVARESSPDIYASIDNAVESIKKQLRRLRGRLRSRRRRTVIGRIMKPVIRFRGSKGGSFPEKGGIAKVDSFADKPMHPEEAKMELKLMNKDFIMFKNADTGEANVLYKRGNGGYGLIEPPF